MAFDEIVSVVGGELTSTLAGRGLATGTKLVLERVDDGVLLLPARPDARRLYVEPTTRCNLACATCIRHSWEEGQTDLDFALFSDLVAQLAAFPELRTAHFAGFGEPLLHPRLFDMLATLRAAGVRTELTTNGLLLDDATALGLAKAGLGTLIISVDGVEPETYAAIRTNADLPLVLANLRRMARLRAEAQGNAPRVGVEFVATRSNYHEIPALLRLADELHLDYLLLSNVLPYSEPMVGQELYGGDPVELPVTPWYRWHWGPERLRLPQMALRTQRLCRFVEGNSFVLAADGKISPCYAMMHPHREFILGREKRVERWTVGDLNRQTLLDIWTDPEYVRFRSRVRRFAFPSCPDCSAVDACYFVQANAEDCWANIPSCADCLWSRGIVLCF